MDDEQAMTASQQRVVVYVRISDDPEGTERGVDRQEADCRANAAARGWEAIASNHRSDSDT
jgi:DNA invertase Pin-like site-specific DNA recombinase